ncbi:MAG TPA: hypothetical protein VL100_03020 [Croceibacterium sp.]|nr:hypothetical protein [Croceibacterium sp.]
MTSKPHLTRCATIAIAATLALGSPPLLAQDVAAPPVTAAPPPTIIVPDIAPAPVPAPAPTVVLPAVSEPEAVAPAEPALAAPRAETTNRTARAPAARPAPAPVAAAPEPATPDVTPVDTTMTETAPVAPPVAAAPLPAPELAPTPVETRSVDNTLAVVLGILAALALIVIGFFALRRKGPKRYAAAEPRIERPIPARAEPLPAATAAPEFPAGLEAGSRSISYTAGAFGAAAARPASGLSHSGASVPLPREVPKTYEEREALIRRMVEAKPDRANPFRSKGARAKRARLILNSLDRDFKHTDPWIDLSQYSSNWPELARRQSAAA